jgi:hypothetical protein
MNNFSIPTLTCAFKEAMDLERSSFSEDVMECSKEEHFKSDLETCSYREMDLKILFWFRSLLL